MNSIAIGGCKCRCHAFKRRIPNVVIAPIIDHKDGHYVRPNKVII
jgi:hypothetical protein